MIENRNTSFIVSFIIKKYKSKCIYTLIQIDTYKHALTAIDSIRIKFINVSNS